MSFYWLLRLAPFLQNVTIRAMPVPSRPSSATPLGPDSSLAAPSLLFTMTTSVIRRPRVTFFGPSPPPPTHRSYRFRPFALSYLLRHHFDTSLHPSSSSSFSLSSPPSSSFDSAAIPAVSGPLVSGSRASPSAAFSSNPSLYPPPSSPPHSSPLSSQASFHSRPIDGLPPLPVLRSSSNPSSVACPACQVDFGSDSGSKAKYMAHLRKHHSSDVFLVPLQIPDLDSPLIRCNRCHWTCSGQAGLTKHQATNQSCRLLAPSSSASFISSPTVLSPPFSDGSPSLSDSAPPLSPASDDELMALFGPGLFNIHRAWDDPFFLVVERLLGIIHLIRSCSAEAASLAFNILPGHLSFSEDANPRSPQLLSAGFPLRRRSRISRRHSRLYSVLRARPHRYTCPLCVQLSPSRSCRNQAHSQDGAAPTGASDRRRHAIRRATARRPHRPRSYH